MIDSGDPGKGKEAWMSLEYYNYHTLGDVMTDRAHYIIPEMWDDVFVKLREILLEWSTFRPTQMSWIAHIDNFAYEMYVTKTEREYKALRQILEVEYPGLFTNSTLEINGVHFNNFHEIWPVVKKYVEQEIIPSTDVCFIHGDCCFSNILYSVDDRFTTLRFIDPRGSFGQRGVWGDPRYDVAKLMHSADGGYEFLNNNQFVLNFADTKSGRTKFKYWFTGGGNADISITFDKVFFEDDDRFDQKQILMIQGLQFISMAARHYENKQRQVVQYLTGVELLNEALKL